MTSGSGVRPDAGAVPGPDPLRELIAEIEAAAELPPLDLVKAAPGLSARATSAIAAARADAMIAVTRDRHHGMTPAELARRLGQSRSGISAAIGRRLAALGKPPGNP